MCSDRHIQMIDVTDKNIEQILALRLHEEQKNYVDSLTDCLNLSKVDSQYVIKGLYYDDRLVGFVMFGLFEDHRAWLKEFLIDQNYQGLGLGSIMLSTVITYMLEAYHDHDIYLSVVQSNERAVYLYKKFGFQMTSEIVEVGEYVMKYENHHRMLQVRQHPKCIEALIC